MCYSAWQNANRIAEVYDNGPNYMYSLMCDYESYMQDFGYVSIPTFLEKWSCIPRKAFDLLEPGDIIYDCAGTMYRVCGHPFESDDEHTSFVEVAAVHVQDDGTQAISNMTETFSSGDMYYAQRIHDDYNWKKKQIKESEGKPCPILITKTNQPQS